MLVKSEVKPASKQELDALMLVKGRRYTKETLAKIWEVNRRTIYRWHQVAMSYGGGYYTGFHGYRVLAECEDCGGVKKIDDLERIQLKRRDYKYLCLHCLEDKKKPIVRQQLYSRSYVRYSYTQAIVLRLIGGLIQTHGRAKTIEILTTSQEKEHKKIRNYLRNINWDTLK